MKTWGRQYRFLYFFTLVAGLVVPLLVMLNLVYLCFSRNFGDYDSQFYSLCIVFRILPLMSGMAALSAIVIMAMRYPFRNCIMPLLFVLMGTLASKAYDPFLIFYSDLRNGLQYNFPLWFGFLYYLQTFCALIGPGVVYLISLLLKRLLKGRKTLAASLTMLFWVLFNGGVVLIYTVLWGNWSKLLIPNPDYILQTLTVMLLTSVALLLIFHFIIPTDEIPQEEKAEEQHDKLINDR